jgi:transcriptional enhancer factor
MYVTSEQVPPTQVHCFTKLSTPNAQLEGMAISRTQDIWPQIASIWNDGSPECEIVLAESTLELAAQLPSGAALGIELSLLTHCNLSSYENFQCKTRFFNDEVPIDETVKHIEYDSKFHVLRSIPFGSQFWAKSFMQLAMKIRAVGRHIQRAYDATVNGEDATASEEAAKYVEQEIRSTLNKLSVVQEIYATHRNSGDRRRLFAMFWKFEQAPIGEKGSTTWRSLILDQGISSQAPVEDHDEDRHRPTVQVGLTPNFHGLGLTHDFNGLGVGLHAPHNANHMLTEPHSQLQLPLPEFSTVTPFTSIMACQGGPQQALLAPSSSIHHYTPSPADISDSIDFTSGNMHLQLCLDPDQSSLFHDDSHAGGSASSSHIPGVFDHHHAQPWATTAYQPPYVDSTTSIYHNQQERSFEDNMMQEELHSTLHVVPRANPVSHDRYTDGGALVGPPLHTESFSENHEGLSDNDNKTVALEVMH